MTGAGGLNRFLSNLPPVVIHHDERVSALVNVSSYNHHLDCLLRTIRSYRGDQPFACRLRPWGADGHLVPTRSITANPESGTSMSNQAPGDLRTAVRWCPR